MSAGRGAAAEGPEVSGGGGNGLAVFAGSQDAAHDLETLSKHKVTGGGGCSPAGNAEVASLQLLTAAAGTRGTKR